MTTNTPDETDYQITIKMTLEHFEIVAEAVRLFYKASQNGLVCEYSVAYGLAELNSELQHQIYMWRNYEDLPHFDGDDITPR
jgi:hypothetical protein